MKHRTYSQWDYPKTNIEDKDKKMFGIFTDSESKTWDWDFTLARYIKRKL
jgi:hypothetical protein